MKKTYQKIFLLTLLLLIMFFHSPVLQAQNANTLIPAVAEEGCVDTINDYEMSVAEGEKPAIDATTLGCAFRTGRFSLAMLPFVITSISNFLLGLVSLIALIFVSLGGFFYVTGGVSAKKDQGKQFITNALLGMALSFLAWSIVQAVMIAVTSL